uniref:BESS domain-containing protein n=1 Tax=Schizaphis graminum TaxID=13262 RepID=A0A2S2PL05_SCHGA
MDDIVDVDISEVSEVDLNISSNSAIHQTHKKKKSTNITPFQKTLIEHLNKNNEKELDPDRHLVMSFLPYLKKLNNDQKLDFQIHALKYLKNITQPQTTPDHPIYGSYPTYYPLAQNMTSNNIQYPYNSSVSTHPYSYPYASQSQTSVPPIEIPINPLNSQYSNTEHAIQTQQYTPISQLPPSNNS